MLNTSTTSSKLTVDDKQMQVEIIDETHVPTREDILDTVVTLTSQAGETVDVKIGDVARVEEGVALMRSPFEFGQDDDGLSRDRRRIQ